MSTKHEGKTAVKEPAALRETVSFETFLEKLGARDRVNAEKHVAACEAEPDQHHAKLWQRMTRVMMTLAAHSAKFSGQQSAQFYAADGKYRMQVFALEDKRDGELGIYCADVMDQAIKAKILAPRKRGEEGDEWHLGDSSATLKIERLDGSTPNPAVFFKEMLGWNRKAIRIGLPVSASTAQTRAAEAICALSVPQAAEARG